MIGSDARSADLDTISQNTRRQIFDRELSMRIECRCAFRLVDHAQSVSADCFAGNIVAYDQVFATKIVFVEFEPGRRWFTTPHFDFEDLETQPQRRFDLFS